MLELPGYPMTFSGLRGKQERGILLSWVTAKTVLLVTGRVGWVLFFDGMARWGGFFRQKMEERRARKGAGVANQMVR